MQLQRLTGLEREKIIDEYKNVLKDIARFKEILANERLVFNIIKEELTELQEEFGDHRYTEIISETKEISTPPCLLRQSYPRW